MNAESSTCPKCGAAIPSDLMAGIRLFNCPYCGQTVHPANCGCSEHDPDLAEDLRSVKLGLEALRELKRIRRENEAERLELGLPSESTDRSSGISVGGTTIVFSGGTTQKICVECGTGNRKEANFCKNCGNRF